MTWPRLSIAIKNGLCGGLPWNIFVIAQGCGQTLGLGLGQSKDIIVVFY